MLMTGVITGAVTPKYKTKSNPFNNSKVRFITKYVVSFWSFPVPLRVTFAAKELPALKHGKKTNTDNNQQAEMINLTWKSKSK